ncbi:hypothetical protein NITMOv2_2561 [Nitrospira moscoviensis]|uniref:Uncharacterized protein n=1 Tax=Nitrospira moscoviensis TaxID=42253 RepID=A0A0K2GDP9_NITMO|nr:hypothetical protein NITMOv2_2561 [Nitrospira moscoviensis]
MVSGSRRDMNWSGPQLRGGTAAALSVEVERILINTSNLNAQRCPAQRFSGGRPGERLVVASARGD